MTGQEKQYASGRSDQLASHVCCTVEMTSITPDQPCNTMLFHILVTALFSDDIAVIDEIQMLADSNRGGAWSRALLGVPAREVHVCGEPGAVSLIKRMMSEIGEDVEVSNASTHNYIKCSLLLYYRW